MPSLKREEEYKINHQRYSDMKKGFKTSLLMALIPSAGVWLVLTLYYFIRTLAMLAGGSAFFGQIILNYANGTNEKSDLAVEIPYLYMAFLIVVAILTSFQFSLRKNSLFILHLSFTEQVRCMGLLRLLWAAAEY